MEILKGNLIRIQSNGDLLVELWNGGQPVMVTRLFEPGSLARTHMNHDPLNFERNALTRNILLHQGN